MSGTVSEEDWKKMSKLVDLFYNRPDAEPFRAPVDWKALGLHDYPKLISEPMDLGTVKKNLTESAYTSLAEVGKDVHKIWKNCQTYNADESDFWKLAKSLEKKWDDKFQKLLQQCQASTAGIASSATAAPQDAASTTSSSKVPANGGDVTMTDAASAASTSNNEPPQPAPPAKVTLAEKKAFAKSLFGLTKEDLGKLLVDLEAKCPAALQRNAAEDEVELNVDVITAPVLQELVQFVSLQKKKTNSNNGSSNNNAKRQKTTTAASATASAGAS